MEFTQELDKQATHLALRMRNNVLPVQVWTEALSLDSEAVDGAPSPISWGRLKFYVNSK